MSLFAGMPGDDDPEPESCGKCGADVEWFECETCGGAGLDGHECGQDCCDCADPDEPNVPCGICDGAGGWSLCSDSKCRNPLPITPTPPVKEG